MGRPAGWMKQLTGREAMRSPGAPSHRREVERQFWAQIATGITSEKAAEAVGVSPAVGTRWFRHRGGMPLLMAKPVGGRYLSFAEREEIGLLRAQAVGVREIARRIDRMPLNGLEGVATPRGHARRHAGVSAVRRALEVRACGEAAKARQTGDEPTSARLCPAALGGDDPRCPWAHDRRPSTSPVHRTEQATPRRPPMGQWLVPGADCQPPSGGLPG